MRIVMSKDSTKYNKNPYLFLLDVILILLFVIGSYFTISSKYNFAMGDEGTYAFKTKLFYETHTLDLKEQSALSLGQIMMGYLFSLPFSFSLRTLHISAYFAVFLCMITFYLLLLQTGIDRYLALIGSLTLFINPMTLRLIDWYITEPFFLLYFLLALNFYVRGLKSNKIIYLYIGSIFAVIAVLTRQFAIVISLSLIMLILIYRKHLKHLVHIFISAIIPIGSLAAFYLFSASPGDTGQLYAGRIVFMKKLLNPLHLIPVLLRDALYSIHYVVLYTLPLFIILLVGVFIKRRSLKSFIGHKPYAAFGAFAFISLGTTLIYLRINKIMPYLPNLLGIGELTYLFNIKILDAKVASIILTFFTALCAIILLANALQHLEWKRWKKIIKKGEPPDESAPLRHFMYFNGIFYFLMSVVVVLIYDRYIFPLALFAIFFILLQFDWIKSLPRTTFIIFILIYAIFIFPIKKNRIKNEVLWDAGDYLMSQGVQPIEINGGSGFGFYYNFHTIRKLYQGVNVGRPLNWHKFHPMATYFLSFNRALKDSKELDLFHSIRNQDSCKAFEREVFIYKRKEGYKGPIWMR